MLTTCPPDVSGVHQNGPGGTQRGQHARLDCQAGVRTHLFHWPLPRLGPGEVERTVSLLSCSSFPIDVCLFGYIWISLWNRLASCDWRVSVSITHCSVLNRLAESRSVQLWHSSLLHRLDGSDGSGPVDSNMFHFRKARSRQWQSEQFL